MQQFTQEQPTKKVNYFLSQPHQPFFLFGFIWAIVMMLLYGLSYKGVLTLSVDAVQFHVYTMIFIVFSHVFHGFLFTTFPRFCMSQEIPKPFYLRLFWLYEGAVLVYILGAILAPWLALTGMALLFLAHATAVFTLYNVYKAGKTPSKEDPFWILTAHIIGLAAHLLWFEGYGSEVAGYTWNWFAIAAPISFNLYLIFLTFSVAQRMVPFFSHSFEPKDPRFLKTAFILFVLKTLFAIIDFTLAEAVTSILLASYMLREFLRWKLPLFKSPAILWVLHLALFWLPTGLFIGALAQLAELYLGTSFLFMGTHLIALGFLTTVLIGFGTRVTLGHSGQPPHADRYATALFWFIQVVVVARMLYSISIGMQWNTSWLFDLSMTTWILLFILWSVRYGNVLISGKKL